MRFCSIRESFVNIQEGYIERKHRRSRAEQLHDRGGRRKRRDLGAWRRTRRKRRRSDWAAPGGACRTWGTAPPVSAADAPPQPQPSRSPPPPPCAMPPTPRSSFNRKESGWYSGLIAAFNKQRILWRMIHRVARQQRAETIAVRAPAESRDDSSASASRAGE
jgi:hypothetical protein